MTGLILAALLAGSSDDGQIPGFSEEVARRVLCAHELTDLTDLVARATELDDGNGYLNRPELEAAARELGGISSVGVGMIGHPPTERSVRLDAGLNPEYPGASTTQAGRPRPTKARGFGIASGVLFGLGAATAGGGAIAFSIPARQAVLAASTRGQTVLAAS